LGDLEAHHLALQTAPHGFHLGKFRHGGVAGAGLGWGLGTALADCHSKIPDLLSGRGSKSQPSRRSGPDQALSSSLSAKLLVLMPPSEPLTPL
jgi:hypothetical protein